MLAAWYHPILTVLFFMTCVLLILIVLLQKGRGGGLGAMFGGAGSSAFGTRTGDVLTWVTIVLTAMFLLLAIITTMVFRPTATDVSAPVFVPGPPGDIDQTNNVMLASSTVGAEIWYQVDDSEPARFQSGRPVPVPAGSTLTAWAKREGWTTSDKVHEVYGVGPVEPVDIIVAAPQFDPQAPGVLGETNLVALTTGTLDATMWYQIDDSEPAIFDGQAISVPSGAVLKAWASRPGWVDSPVAYGLYGVAPSPEDGPADAPADVPATDATETLE